MPLLTLLNPWVLLGLIAVVAATYLTGYMNGKGQAADERLRLESVALRAANAAQAAAAAEIAKIEIRHTTIKQKVQRETIEKPVYRDCRHSPDGLQLVNQALGHTTSRPGDRQLPGATGDAAR